MRWITRERARVDRIACPWLISRFVDPKPEFLFVPAREVRAAAERERAIPYDIPDVELGQHGAAKSVVGAAHFRRLAAERGLAIGAVAAGTEPDAQLAPGAVKGLAGDGLEPALTRPRPVTLYDLDS